MQQRKISVNTEKEELRLRCIAGNAKLNEAWERIKGMDTSSTVWSESIDKWHLANEKLSTLCSYLETLGYDICLYIEKGVRTRKCLTGEGSNLGCRVCPSKLPYWENELMKLPSGSDPEPK